MFLQRGIEVDPAASPDGAAQSQFGHCRIGVGFPESFACPI
jgi:hypothetical protein